MTSSLVHAVSLSGQIEKFGAYAGLAAVVGLAVLSLLYFSQAREVKRLREWAGRAPERAAEIGQRVATDAQRRVVAQPVATPQTVAAQQAPRPATAAATVAGAQSRPATGTAGASTGPLAPAAPAPGTASPVVPASGTQPVRAQVQQAPASPPSSVPSAPVIPVPPGAAPAGTAAGTAPRAPGAPATAPGAGAPRAAVPSATPPAARPPSAPPPAGSSNGPPVPAAVRPQGALSPRGAVPPQASRFASSPVDEPRGRAAKRSSGRLVAMIVGGAVTVLAVGVVAVIQLTGGADEQPPADNRIGAAPAPGTEEELPLGGEDRRTRSTPVNRRNTTVAVLNGTTRDGLARSVANKVEESGFALGTVGNNADQARSATIVSYTPGNRRAAQTVADIVRVGRDAVEPIDRNTAVAAPGARVVVTVGADRVE